MTFHGSNNGFDYRIVADLGIDHLGIASIMLIPVIAGCIETRASRRTDAVSMRGCSLRYKTFRCSSGDALFLGDKISLPRKLPPTFVLSTSPNWLWQEEQEYWFTRIRGLVQWCQPRSPTNRRFSSSQFWHRRCSKEKWRRKPDYRMCMTMN